MTAQYIGEYLLVFVVYIAVYLLIEYVFPEYGVSETKFYKFFSYVYAISVIGGPYFLLGEPGGVISFIIIGHAIYKKVSWRESS